MSEQSTHHFAESYMKAFIKLGSQAMMNNVESTCSVIKCQEACLPTSLNNTEYHSSYVVSPYNALIDYSIEELVKIQSAGLRAILKLLVKLQGLLLKRGKVNKNFMINNYCLSTNLYPEMNEEQINCFSATSIKAHPHHAIVWRSLNRHSNDLLMTQLEQIGYALIPARQVYLFDEKLKDFSKSHNFKIDKKLCEKTPFRWVCHDDIAPSDYVRIVELYNFLNVDKYSRHNPQFSERLIAHWHANKLLHFMGLRNEQGLLDGVVGIFENESLCSAPLVGYDTRLPKKFGLYRMLIHSVLKHSLSNKKILNLSSGSAHFKRLRGGQPYIEYTAVYTKHLSLTRRLLWKIIGFSLEHIFVPLLKKYQL